jgi:hypothetical protein
MKTGEIIQNNLTHYGDVKPPALKGIINKNIVSVTRTRIWQRIMQPMTTCGPKNECRNKELAEKMIWRDPRKREGPDHFLGLV